MELRLYYNDRYPDSLYTIGKDGLVYRLGPILSRSAPTNPETGETYKTELEVNWYQTYFASRELTLPKFGFNFIGVI
jgi:hypothetical protein